LQGFMSGEHGGQEHPASEAFWKSIRQGMAIKDHAGRPRWHSLYVSVHRPAGKMCPHDFLP